MNARHTMQFYFFLSFLSFSRGAPTFNNWESTPLCLLPVWNQQPLLNLLYHRGKVFRLWSHNGINFGKFTRTEEHFCDAKAVIIFIHSQGSEQCLKQWLSALNIALNSQLQIKIGRIHISDKPCRIVLDPNEPTLEATNHDTYCTVHWTEHVRGILAAWVAKHSSFLSTAVATKLNLPQSHGQSCDDLAWCTSQNLCPATNKQKMFEKVNFQKDYSTSIT